MIASLVIKLNHDYKRCYHPLNMFTPKERSSNNKLKEARLHMIHPNAYNSLPTPIYFKSKMSIKGPGKFPEFLYIFTGPDQV